MKPRTPVAYADRVQAPQATIAITTKDRRDDLRTALRSAVQQTGCVVEILVVDDGSNDGTAEMVRTEFPHVRIESFETSRGYIQRRNDAAELAAAPVLVSIDDDAAFTAPDSVARTVAAFNHPRIAAVAMPYVDLGRKETHVRQRAPNDSQIWIIEPFRGTAHALRVDVFRMLGGYRAELVRQAEEADLCLRMLAAGYVTRLGDGAPIEHYESPNRNWRRLLFYMARNDLVYAWHNVPMPYFVVRVMKTVVWMLGPMVVRHRDIGPLARGLVAGFAYMVRHRSRRSPVARSVYRLSHAIRGAGALPLEAIESQLRPPLSQAGPAPRFSPESRVAAEG